VPGSISGVGGGLLGGGGAIALTSGACAGGSGGVGSITLTEYAGGTHFVVGIEGQFYHGLGRGSPTHGCAEMSIPLGNPAGAIEFAESEAEVANCLIRALKVIGVGLW